VLALFARNSLVEFVVRLSLYAFMAPGKREEGSAGMPRQGWRSRGPRGLSFRRNSRDWQRRECRVVDTALIDQETIYAPRHGNDDQLVLGLKGSLNEYELDLLRQRSFSARP
jgi:hypothetical protein